jgi:hypothetical protein
VTTFTRAKRSRTTNNVIALLGSAMMVFPVYWMFATALKQSGQILSAVPKVIPWPISVENFQRALSQPQFWVFARNSITVALSTVILSLLIALGASIAVARFNFIGRKAFLVVLVLIQMIPGSAMVIPIYLMLRSVNALDFIPGLVLTYMTFVLPFTIWTLRGFVEGVPVELEEAALVDGFSRVKAHPCPAAVADAGDRRHIDLRVHIRLGRLPVRLRDHEIPGQLHAAGLARVVPDAGGRRLRRHDRSVVDLFHPRTDLLPAGAAQARRRDDQWCGQGVTAK